MHTSTTSTVPLEPWTAAQLQHATQGHWHNGRAPSTQIKRILTDSRHAEAGDVFLALKGERFDAHDFVAQVAANGCQVAILERPLDLDICQLVVSGHPLGAWAFGRLSSSAISRLTGHGANWK